MEEYQFNQLNSGTLLEPFLVRSRALPRWESPDSDSGVPLRDPSSDV